MFQRIGHVGHRNDRRKPGIIEKHGSRILPRDNPSECHRAHKGLFVGLLLFLATLVVLALFYIFMRSHNYSGAITLYQASYITLFSVGIVAASIALYQLRVLSLRELSEEDAFDDNLLLIGLLGMLFYDMFLLVPAVEAKGENSTAGSMFVGKAIIEMVQALLQVFLILEGSRRQAATVNHMARKPGRTIITFLLILNLAMWIFNTFGLKYAENHSIYRSYYTGIAWKIITHLSLPLIIFFRFHSTVCLADIWTNAYRMHSCASV
uniref:Otopetrin-2 n=1 Tax=Mesocestoides corti TaxID=53468 RepID=A0A5K3FQY9_MESCO